PAVSFLAGSGISTDDGILVDTKFETNVPGVFAVGDVARFFDPVFGRSGRIEHWSSASYQGAEAGKVLAGAGGGYDAVSTFFTESFGLPLKVFGDTSRHDDRGAGGFRLPLSPRRAGRARLVRGRRRDRLLPRARPPGRDAAHGAGQGDGGG